MTAEKEPVPIRRPVAKHPKHRTVTVTGDGEFADWEMTARVDFPVRVLEELVSNDISKIIGALNKIVVLHNFPNEDGELADNLHDVSPYDGLMKMSGKFMDERQKLPNR